ncbi:MAG: acyl-CoA mutase large subunit family protein [Candidatus Aminicenantes bacterium]|nr:acyl-CoA mutase large subunit family protein [Candidatus Aminicenantes bacterium]
MPEKHKPGKRIELEQSPDFLKDFPPHTYEEWQKKVGEDLVTGTYEGIDLKPIYRKEDTAHIPGLDNLPGFAPYIRGTKAAGYRQKGWEICQEIKCGNPGDFNRELKHDLHRGQDAVFLALDEAAREGLDPDKAENGAVGINGVSISTYEDFEKTLSGIDLEKYPLYIDAGLPGLEIAMMLTVFCRETDIGIAKIKGSIESDPLGLLLTRGKLPVSLETAFDRLAAVTGSLAQIAPQLKTMAVKGSLFHNAGADAVRELAFSLSTAVEYIDRMIDRGLDINDIVRSIRFTFGAGSFFFMEVAKLRAVRMLWERIATAYGADEESRKITMHAETSFYNQTRLAPYVNMLRTTTEAFSAVVGGVDSLTTNPFDECGGKPDRFSRRVARNTQVILKEEAHLDQLIDPAGGSYYVEALTRRVAQAAWDEFREIQRRGGMLKALRQGYPQEEIERVAAQRKKDLSEGKSKLVGVNAYVVDGAEKLEKKVSEEGEIFQMRSAYLKEHRASRSEEKISELIEQIAGAAADSTNKQKFFGGPGWGRISNIEYRISNIEGAPDDAASAKSPSSAPRAAGPPGRRRQEENIIQTGTEALLAGGTLGEIFSALNSGSEESFSIKPLSIQRAVEIFEEQAEVQGESK